MQAGSRRYSGGSRPWPAAVAVEDGEVLDGAVVDGTFLAPYTPGYLALRQLPLQEQGCRTLRVQPDVLLINATGRDHPRRAGLALHLGALLSIATVGVTDRPLAASGDVPGPHHGDRAQLLLDGEVVGYRVCTRSAARPVCVSAGWRTEPETAVAVVLAVSRAERTPLPISEARPPARAARSLT